MEVLVKEGVNEYGHYTYTSSIGNIFTYAASQEESILLVAYIIYGHVAIEGTLVLKDGKNYILTNGGEFLHIDMEE